MNTPFSSHAWTALRDRAASQLRPDFADQVLRSARGPLEIDEATGWFANPFTVSAATAAFCLLLVCLLHAHLTTAASLRHLEDWQEITMQTASLDPNP